jgi:hypothetical protein
MGIRYLESRFDLAAGPKRLDEKAIASWEESTHHHLPAEDAGSTSVVTLPSPHPMSGTRSVPSRSSNACAATAH